MPSLVEVGQASVELGSTLVDPGPESAECRPTSAKVGPTRNSGHLRANLRRLWLTPPTIDLEPSLGVSSCKRPEAILHNPMPDQWKHSWMTGGMMPGNPTAWAAEWRRDAGRADNGGMAHGPPSRTRNAEGASWGRCRRHRCGSGPHAGAEETRAERRAHKHARPVGPGPSATCSACRSARSGLGTGPATPTSTRPHRMGFGCDGNRSPPTWHRDCDADAVLRFSRARKFGLLLPGEDTRGKCPGAARFQAPHRLACATSPSSAERMFSSPAQHPHASRELL